MWFYVRRFSLSCFFAALLGKERESESERGDFFLWKSSFYIHEFYVCFMYHCQFLCCDLSCHPLDIILCIETEDNQNLLLLIFFWLKLKQKPFLLEVLEFLLDETKKGKLKRHFFRTTRSLNLRTWLFQFFSAKQTKIWLLQYFDSSFNNSFRSWNALQSLERRLRAWAMKIRLFFVYF